MSQIKRGWFGRPSGLRLEWSVDRQIERLLGLLGCCAACYSLWTPGSLRGSSARCFCHRALVFTSSASKSCGSYRDSGCILAPQESSFSQSAPFEIRMNWAYWLWNCSNSDSWMVWRLGKASEFFVTNFYLIRWDKGHNPLLKVHLCLF